MESVTKNQTSVIKPLFDYLKKQRENQKFVKTVEITATFSLISFFLVFAIRPTITTISALIGDIKSKQLLTRELRNKIDNLISAQDAFSTVQERYQVVDSSLPDKVDYFGIYEQISQTAKNSRISIDKLDFNLNETRDAIDPNAGQISLSLNSLTNFSDSLQFVSQLLQNQRLINISTITFGVANDTGQVEPISGVTGTPLNPINTRFTAIVYYWNNHDQK